MRLDPKLVHPSIFKATDAAMWSGQVTSPTGASTVQASVEFQKVWFQEYGKGCFAYLALCVFGFVGAVQLAQLMDKPWRGLLMIVVLLAMVAGGLLAYRRNLRHITAPELGAILPLLDLTDVQRAYAETLVALDRSGRTPAEIEETMGALNALLDEDGKLIETRDSITGSAQRLDRQTLLSEREKIASRVASSQDPDAKAAFESSLGLVNERIASYDVLGSALERIDAHQELLRQAVLATRDAALHRAGTPIPLPALGTDFLCAAVALARAQTTETERALAELRAI